MMSTMKTLAVASTAAIPLRVTAPNVFAQAATTLGGGGMTRANDGAAGAGGTSGANDIAGTSGAASGEVGGRAESVAKGNDPTGTNGATNNRY